MRTTQLFLLKTIFTLSIKLLLKIKEKMKHKGKGKEVVEIPQDGTGNAAIAAEERLISQRQNWEAHIQQSPVNNNEEHSR
jgi:hypothetical protein